MKEEYLGPCCQAAGLTLMNVEGIKPLSVRITNGIASELVGIGNSTNKTPNVILVMNLCGFTAEEMKEQPSINKVRMQLRRVVEKKKGSRRTNLEAFLNEEFLHYKLNMARLKARMMKEELPPLSAPSSRLSSAAESSGSKSSDEDPSTSSTGISNGDRESSPKEDAALCCVLDKGHKCDNPAGRAKLKGKAQHPDLKHDESKSHNHVCTIHEALIKGFTRKGKQTQEQCSQKVFSRKRKRTQEEEDEPQVDFSTLSIQSLRKYKKKYKITHRSGVEKAQLEETVAQHFKSIDVVEGEVVTNFFKMTGRLL
ncbi:uncharacterized protein LOC143284226 [Babylonia areolata]|uniref:uncharacterized protein LOC143284226 n=1 Tax=Babylonia areolata TaxID=304850 RepID=UPI003FD5617E